MDEFNKQWNTSKFIWKIENSTIQRVENPKSREVYDDMYYRKKYFFTLKEAKEWVRLCSAEFTPEGHRTGAVRLEEYNIIK